MSVCHMFDVDVCLVLQIGVVLVQLEKLLQIQHD